MRILLLCREYPPARHGGTGAFVRDYAKALVDAGHNVVVLGGPTSGSNDDDVQRSGFRIERVGLTERGPDVLDAVRYALAVRKSVTRIVAREKFDIVEAPSHGGEHAFLPSLGPDTHVVTRLHGLLFITPSAAPDRRTSNPLKALYRALRRLVFRSLELRGLFRSSGLVFLTDHYRQFLLSAVPRLNRFPNCVVPNGLVSGWRSVAGCEETISRPAVVYAGRISTAKGIDTLLCAAEQMCITHPHLTWYLFGRVVSADLFTNPPGKTLVERGVVKLLGSKPRDLVRSCLQHASAVVFPSRYEAFALVPLESMAAGATLIASDIPSNRELIGSDAGLLFPPGDSGALAKAVAWALDNPQESLNLAAAGKERVVKYYTIDRTVADSTVFYSHLKTLSDD